MIEIIYNSRPYELTYAGKLIEKETGLIEHTDFDFAACPEGKTIINYLRDMNKTETDAVQALFDIHNKEDRGGLSVKLCP